MGGKGQMWVIQSSQVYNSNFKDHSHLSFTCSKSTIATLEKGVKYVQS